MRTIEITTTHNVVIQYDLARVWDRIFAYLIDITLQIIVLLIIGGILSTLLGPISKNLLLYVWVGLYLVLYVGYDLLMEIFNNGQSIGKMILGIKVVRLDGKEVKVGDYLLRWLFRPFDTAAYMFGAVAIILISSTQNSQRLGDILAHTTVIKLRKNLSTSISELLNIKSLNNYEPQYQQVRKLSEEDMLLTKETILSYTKYKNPAYFEAMEMLTHKLCAKMEVAPPKDNHLIFLRTLLSDYIVLTR